LDKPSFLDDIFPPYKPGSGQGPTSRDTNKFFEHLLEPHKRTPPAQLRPPESSALRDNPFLPEIPSLAPPIVPQPVVQPPKPRQWTRRYLQNEIIRRLDARTTSIQRRLSSVTRGLTMPELERIPVGSGRQFELAIMFIDICGFTKLPNITYEDQKKILTVLNIFTGEMMHISRDYTGIFEKNTGDGLMAYFGTETRDPADSVRRAADAALVMDYVHYNHINPWLRANGYPTINFRIAIDYGPVTIARIGAPSGLSAFVAIGRTANTANRLMRLLPNGGIALGDHAAALLPEEWQATCMALGPIADSNLPNGDPYLGWELRHRLSYPLR
jgi:adenylate cyclase